jgi:hypothetical protein
LQWDYLSGAATTKIVDNAAEILESGRAKSDGKRRRSICIPPDQPVRGL